MLSDMPSFVLRLHYLWGICRTVAAAAPADDAAAGLQLAQALAAAGKDGNLDQLRSFTCRNYTATVPPILQVRFLPESSAEVLPLIQSLAVTHARHDWTHGEGAA